MGYMGGIDGCCMIIGGLSGLRLLLLSRLRGGDPCCIIIGAGAMGGPIRGYPGPIVAMGGGECECDRDRERRRPLSMIMGCWGTIGAGGE